MRGFNNPSTASPIVSVLFGCSPDDNTLFYCLLYELHQNKRQADTWLITVLRVSLWKNCRMLDFRKTQMRPIARNICYRHVHISTHVQWSIQISQPLALYVLSISRLFHFPADLAWITGWSHHACIFPGNLAFNKSWTIQYLIRVYGLIWSQ